jgi:hypothetical protein
VARLPEGEVLFLPAGGSAGRPIVGATVRVRDLSSARRVLDRDAGIRTAIVTKRGASSIFLPPAVTHGLWLEFRQVRGR